MATEAIRTICPTCGHSNEAASKFCAECGSGLTVTCASCGSANPAASKFCGECGTPLAPAALAPAVRAGRGAAGAPVEPPPLAERRRVTVLFADLVGFSGLAEHLDPEELRSVMSDTFAELRSEVEGRDGVVEKFIGDAVVAIFGAPRAHEDDPERAVETALRMHEIVARRSEGAPAPLQLRVGVNSGLVVAGTVGDGSQTGVMGDAVNTAARLQQAAGPGETLVSASVWRRVRQRYEADALGALEVKGRQQQVEAFRIVAKRPPGSRREAPFVGRGEELALLELLWSSTAKGNTHLISLIGEPGVGKSRLLAEFHVPETAWDLRIVCGGERAFGPFLELVERVLGEVPTDLDQLRRPIADLELDEETTLLLAAFLGLSGAPPVVRMADEQQMRQVFAGVWRFLLALASSRPARIVLDDLHWADRGSVDLLGFLLERLSGVPLMLVLAYRPGFEPLERTTLRASHTAIRLEPLSAEESVAMARGVLGVTELPADLERLVATRAEGNPFFVEELLRALLELGSLVVQDGTATLAQVQVDVPDTVQGTILARADRLDPEERSLLQLGAVLGRAFRTELLQAVSEQDDVTPRLERLANAQLLVQQAPDQWAFKHALIQEVVYDTLLLRQRRELHRRVAAALEPKAADDPALLEALAEHYARAEVKERARHYAVLAGDLAQRRMGFVAARERYATALRLWGEGEERGRLELLEKFGRAALLEGDAPTARTALIEAEAGWRSAGETRRAAAVQAWLGRVYWATGETERAATMLEEAIGALESQGPSSELLQSYVWASTLAMLNGRLVDGAALAGKGLELEAILPSEAMRSHLLNTLGVCEANAGDEQGIERLRQSLPLAERSGDALAIGRAYNNLASTLSVYGHNREALEIASRGRELARAAGALSFDAFIAGQEALSLVELGRLDEGEDVSRSLLAQPGVLGVPGLLAASSPLIESLLRRGRYDESRRVLDDVLPLALGSTRQDISNIRGLEATLEEARGNHAAARRAVAEVVTTMGDEISDNDLYALPVMVRLLGRSPETERLLAHEATLQNDIDRARLAECEGWLTGDRDRFREAAEGYARLELPYQEARTLVQAEELERAAAIVERLGVENGPVGTALKEARRADTGRAVPRGRNRGGRLG